MKTAILSIEGTNQIMFSPETEMDRKVLDMIQQSLPEWVMRWIRKDEWETTVGIKRWSFAECKWGRYRHFITDEWLVLRFDTCPIPWDNIDENNPINQLNQ